MAPVGNCDGSRVLRTAKLNVVMTSTHSPGRALKAEGNEP